MFDFILKNRTFLVTILVTLYFSGCAKTQEQRELSKSDNNITIKLEGTVFPSQEKKLIAVVPGYVKKLYVENGDQVKKGDKIYSLDKELIEIEIANKKNEIQSLEKLQNGMYRKGSNIPASNLAAVELKKMAALQSDGYINKFELNQYKKNYINALYSDRNAKQANEENIKREAIEINQKKLELKRLEFNYQHADNFAAIDGFIAGLSITEGETVSRNQAFGFIQNLDTLTVKAGFAEGLFPYIHKNTKAKISFLTTPPYITEASIQKVIPTVDPNFKRMTITLQVPNKNYILQPSTTALVEIPLEKKDQDDVKKYFMGRNEEKVVAIRSSN